jgi:hypothetical protein
MYIYIAQSPCSSVIRAKRCIYTLQSNFGLDVHLVQLQINCTPAKLHTLLYTMYNMEIINHTSHILLKTYFFTKMKITVVRDVMLCSLVDRLPIFLG